MLFLSFFFFSFLESELELELDEDDEELLFFFFFFLSFFAFFSGVCTVIADDIRETRSSPTSFAIFEPLPSSGFFSYTYEDILALFASRPTFTVEAMSSSLPWGF